MQVEYQTVTRYNKHVNWQLRNAQKNVCTSQNGQEQLYLNETSDVLSMYNFS